MAPSTTLTLAQPDVRRSLRAAGAGRCVAWTDQPLPEGCVPGRARLGVERSDDGRCVLLVERGVTCRPEQTSVLALLRTGSMQFESIDDLFVWVDRWLVAPTTPSVTSTDQITDLDAVRLPEAPTAACFVDAERLYDDIASEVVGQGPALRTLCRRVREHLAQEAPRRPLSLMLLGPTGVGKTAAAGRLAVALGAITGQPRGFVRLDMNEYRERHRVSQMLGAPVGYIGSDRSTPLVDTLSANPDSVVLFDEIDKAHPDVLVTLMAALDSGRLTAADGRTLDLRRAVILFTSNRHADQLAHLLDAVTDEAEIDDTCRSELLAGGMWPELVGRVRSYLYFGPIGDDARVRIAVLSIQRAASCFGLEVVRIDPAVVTAVLARSAELGLGVRNLESDAGAVLGDAFVEHAEAHGAGRVVLRWLADAPTVELAEVKA